MSNEKELSGKHLIAGEWVSSQGTAFTAVNAKTGEKLPTVFHEAGQAEVETAFAAAVAAAQQTRNLPATRWADLLEAIAESIQQRDTALIARAGAETALPEARLKGELARTTGQLRLFAGLVRDGSWVDAVIDPADPNRQPLPKPDLRRMARPLGPIVVFGASNFPFAFGACGGDTASAFAAGNPVIVKAHPGHPGTNEIFADAVLEALQRTGLPVGMFALLQGAGIEIGGLLVQHPAAEAVGFTGSQRAGRALFDLAAARPRPIPVYAEMGSVNPLVLLPGALKERLEAVVEALAQSVTLGGGQFCTKPGLILYVQNEDGDRFARLFGEKMAGLSAATLLNKGIRERFQNTLQQMETAAGVEVRAGGACSGNADCSPSVFSVDSATWRANSVLHEEAFGPAALLVGCRDVADLLVTLQTVAGQLTGTLHMGQTDTTETIRLVADTLEQKVGRLIFNGYPTGVEVGHAMLHGGPYPATTAAGTTSVGSAAIRRFARPIAYQNVPDPLLPPALQNANPLGIWRTVNGALTQSALS